MQQNLPPDALSQGMEAGRAGRWEEARDLFFNVIDRDPSNLDAWLWLAAIAEDPEESVAYLRRALEINHRSVRAQKGMEWARERLAGQQETISAPSALPPVPPPTLLPGVDVSGLEPLSQPLSAYAHGRPSGEAPPAALVEEAPFGGLDDAATDPLDWDSIVARLRAADVASTAPESASTATPSPPAPGVAPVLPQPPPASKPTDSAEMVREGKQALEAGQVEQAIESLQAALRSSPDDVEAHEQLGVALYQVGRSEEALREFQALVRLAPAHAEAHANIGFLQAELGHPDEAIAALRRAVGYKPDLVEALVSLGELLRAGGRLQEAVDSWERALALRPELADVRANLEEARAALAGGA